MKKYILVLVLFFSLISICNAEEFKTNKRFNAGDLAKEIELATGLVLQGKTQMGYMSTSDNNILIKLKDRDLTADEKAKIETAIKNHIPKTEEQKEAEEKAKKDKTKAKLKSLGLDDEEIKTIMKED